MGGAQRLVAQARTRSRGPARARQRGVRRAAALAHDAAQISTVCNEWIAGLTAMAPFFVGSLLHAAGAPTGKRLRQQRAHASNAVASEERIAGGSAHHRLPAL